MLDFCIIGSGISGSTIAHILSKKYNVEIFDKARGIGGRASNKRFVKKESFDHGVQYICPKSKEFKKFINFDLISSAFFCISLYFIILFSPKFISEFKIFSTDSSIILSDELWQA